MTKYKIGGITAASGITFVGQCAKVTIRNKDGVFCVKTFSKRKENLIERTPFLRGFIKLYKTFKMVTGSIIGKIALGILIFGVIMGIISLLFEGTPSSDSVELFSNVVLNIISFVMLIGMIIYTFLIRHLHGLEHRFINAYNNGLALTVENVKKQRKETPQCGGTLLGIIIIINIAVSVLNIPTLLVWFLIPSLGYECFLNAKGNRWYNKVLYFPGYVIQLFSTGYKVSDKTIAKYLVGFKAFIKSEERLK